MILNFAKYTAGIASFAGMIAHKFFPASPLGQIYELLFIKEGPLFSAMKVYLTTDDEYAGAFYG